MPLYKTQIRRCSQTTVVIDAESGTAAKNYAKSQMANPQWPLPEDTLNEGTTNFDWVLPSVQPYNAEKAKKIRDRIPEGITIFVAPEDKPMTRKERILHARQKARS